MDKDKLDIIRDATERTVCNNLIKPECQELDIEEVRKLWFSGECEMIRQERLPAPKPVVGG